MALKHLIEAFKTGVRIFKLEYFSTRKDRFGYLGKNAYLLPPTLCYKKNIFLYDNARIDYRNILYVTGGKFIMRERSGAAVGLTVITGNHTAPVGHTFQDGGNTNLKEKDVIVDEDVWLGANVTLLSGTHVCRGCVVGAGTVIRGNKIPPYAIVIGNPAKVVGFRYTVEEIIEHEKILYKEAERLPLDLLEKNYKKYYLNRIREIKQFVSI